MTKYTYEETRKSSELVAELSKAVKSQLYGDMDWVRARTFWKKRLPEMLDQPDELAEALTYTLYAASLSRDWRRD